MPEPFLRADGLTVSFGGLTAIDDVSIAADRAEIVGVIGPNGAGKSTLFDAITGAVRPARGHVWLGGRDVTSWPSHRRARAGLGRTFQRLEVFGSMTTRENLAYATEAPALGASPWRMLRRGGSDAALVDEVLSLLDLEPIAERRVGSLPSGQARLVELGRVLCQRPTLVLLDEPSSGLDPTESAALGASVRAAVDRFGLGVVLVEHDIPLVTALCARLYVLDFGRLLAAGPTSHVIADPTVRAAYLGAVSG